MSTIDKVRERLARVGQDHLLRFADRLEPDQLDALLAQIQALDVEALPELIELACAEHGPEPHFDDLQPAPYFPADPDDPVRPWDRGAARGRGEALIRRGGLACFVVAGGQGTRLGFKGPKGCFPAGAVSGKPLFQIFAEQIIAAERRYGVAIPWYVMTSPMNHEDTIAFFRERSLFGLDEANLHFFPQGVMPSIDPTRRSLLLAAPDEVATNPDGHGGAFRALAQSGALDDMRARGVEHISYFQVDNPLARIVDPAFLGLHTDPDASSAEMSSKMLPKRDPDEKVGVFCQAAGRVRMIEYSDLPGELAGQRLEDGSLRFKAGNPALHLLGVEFVERVNSDPELSLPFHRASKRVTFIDSETGERIEPDEPNAVKLERFVFDALPMAERSVVLETDRVEEFAPIKNAQGSDSPESCHALQTLRAARWLEAVGVRVARTDQGEPDCTLEISPLTAAEPDDLRSIDLPEAIEPGSRVEL